MSAPLLLTPEGLKYRTMIGVGGIGAGDFFALEGNATLGREESRGGRFLEQRDYCKLHIVSHYVSTLLSERFLTVAIGGVGDDEVGHRLLHEMERAKIDVRYVERSTDARTLFSFCFQYPDGSGGNLTTNDSASSRVNQSAVTRAETQFRRYSGSGIALAVPEVPMETRKTLLEMGASYDFFRVASFTSEEIAAALESGFLDMVDLLSINQDEAASAVGLTGSLPSLSEIVERTIAFLSEKHPHLQMILTAGSQGSWSWDGSTLQHIPALTIGLVNGAGAGDAYLAGTIVGLTCSLPLLQAQQLGNLVAALAATSPHTIHPDIDRNTLRTFAVQSRLALSENLTRLLGVD